MPVKARNVVNDFDGARDHRVFNVETFRDALTVGERVLRDEAVRGLMERPRIWRCDFSFLHGAGSWSSRHGPFSGARFEAGTARGREERYDETDE